MLKALFHLGWTHTQSLLFLLLTLFLATVRPSPVSAEMTFTSLPDLSAIDSSPSMLEQNVTSQNSEPSAPSDPLSSPHPIPWNWIMTTYTEFSEQDYFGTSYYRTPSLVSPDGQYAAYSRLKLKAGREFHTSRVTSVMFLEDLYSGDLQVISASSPLADNPLQVNEEADLPGVIAILMPVSWSESGDRVLARQFEGLFSTSDASDYAVIWNRQDKSTTTVSPSNNIEYTHAVLLGWSESNPQEVLFRAGTIGDEDWFLWAVDATGETMLANEDQPKVYGQQINQIWTGPQAQW